MEGLVWCVYVCEGVSIVSDICVSSNQLIDSFADRLFCLEFSHLNHGMGKEIIFSIRNNTEFVKSQTVIV